MTKWSPLVAFFDEEAFFHHHPGGYLYVSMCTVCSYHDE